jgi:hypothetical protein
MKRALALVLFAFSALALAQAPQIKSGAAVYIEQMSGFETYLAAAMMRYDVPLVVVSDKEKADYILKSNVNQIEHGEWETTSATITMIDLRTSQIVFAGSTSTNRYGIKGAAENCVEQLQQFMKKHKK